MLPPSCCYAAALQNWCHHHCRCAAAAPPMLPHYCRHTAATTRLLPSLRCGVQRRVTNKLPPPSLPPHHRQCRHHHRHCQAATAATKLPPLPLSIMKKNSVTGQTLILFAFLKYSDLASNSCMGGCFQYKTPLSSCTYIVIIFNQINRLIEIWIIIIFQSNKSNWFIITSTRKSPTDWYGIIN